MAEVACIGELFIDLTPHAQNNGSWLYAPNPGGAPGNVAVGLARLGHSVSMVSRVGDDAFGKLLVNALTHYGVNASGVQVSATEKTGLSIVTLDGQGDRSFMFYHDKPADLNIDADTITAETLTGVQILHAGILPLSAPVSTEAQRRAMELADKHGAVISCDVNFRPNLWGNIQDMLSAGREMIARAAIVKVTEEELVGLTGMTDFDIAVRGLWHGKMQLCSVTKGSKGAVLYTPQGKHVCDGFVVDAIDTTGAGDAYCAAILSGVLTRQTPELMLRHACAAGALATTKKGAMESLPTRAAILELVR